MSELSTYAGFVGPILAILGFIYARFKIEKNTAVTLSKQGEQIKEIIKQLGEVNQSIKDLNQRFGELCERTKGLEVKGEIIWNAVQSAVTDMLHHPTELRRDELIEKLNNKTITLQELDELKNLLKCKIVETIERKTPKNAVEKAVRESEERQAAIWLIALVEAKAYDMSVAVQKLASSSSCQTAQ